MICCCIESSKVASSGDGLSAEEGVCVDAGDTSEELMVAEPPPITRWINSMTPLEPQGQALLGQLCRTLTLESLSVSHYLISANLHRVFLLEGCIKSAGADLHRVFLREVCTKAAGAHSGVVPNHL